MTFTLETFAHFIFDVITRSINALYHHAKLQLLIPLDLDNEGNA